MKQALTVISEPAYEPVSLAEAKRWFRIESDVTDHDLVLRLLIQAMREDAENLTQRAFISRQLRLYLSAWPSDCEYGTRIVLPKPPLISVDAFRYIDTDGVLQTLATDQYSVHEEYEPGFIIPAYGESWPSIRSVPDAIQITYTTGYAPGSPSDEASSQANIPAKLRLWMEAKANTLNEFREQILAGQVVAIPRNFTDALLDSLVIGTRLF